MALLVALGKTYPFGCGSAALYFKDEGSLFWRWGCFPQGGVFADFLDLGNFTNWTLQDSHTVVLYRGLRPIAILGFPNFQIPSTSSIRLIKSSVYDLDDIIMDDGTYGLTIIIIAPSSRLHL